MWNAAAFNELGKTKLPGLIGIEIIDVGERMVKAILSIREELLASNGYLHAASVVALADTAAGYGCVANLPAGAAGFTTIELKSNHLGTARSGTIECTAKVLHLGRNTHVWDSEVRVQDTGKVIALFRCTQMILYPKQ